MGSAADAWEVAIFTVIHADPAFAAAIYTVGDVTIACQALRGKAVIQLHSCVLVCVCVCVCHTAALSCVCCIVA